MLRLDLSRFTFLFGAVASKRLFSSNTPSDNISDAWRAVAPTLADRSGEPVLVVGDEGPGSIGLYAAGLAVALVRSEPVLNVGHRPQAARHSDSAGRARHEIVTSSVVDWSDAADALLENDWTKFVITRAGGR